MVVAVVALIALSVMAVAFARAHTQLLGVVVAMAERKHINRLVEENKDAARVRETPADRVGPPARTIGSARASVWQPAPDDAVPNGQPGAH